MRSWLVAVACAAGHFKQGRVRGVTLITDVVGGRGPPGRGGALERILGAAAFLAVSGLCQLGLGAGQS